MRHGMRAAGGNPIDDWQRAKKDASVYQIERGLKRMDYLMRQSTAPWKPWNGSKWITRMNRWFLEDPDRPISNKEAKEFLGGIDVDLIEFEEHKKEQIKVDQENEKAIAIALNPTSDARIIWSRLNKENKTWEDLVNAVRIWKSQHLTEDLKNQIELDKQLIDFKDLISIL